MSVRMAGLLIACTGSFVSVLGIFITTMIVHYQHLDYDYLGYAIMRILAISVVSGMLGAVFYRQSKVVLFAIGVIAGPVVASVFVMLILATK